MNREMKFAYQSSEEEEDKGAQQTKEQKGKSEEQRKGLLCNFVSQLLSFPSIFSFFLICEIKGEIEI